MCDRYTVQYTDQEPSCSMFSGASHHGKQPLSAYQIKNMMGLATRWGRTRMRVTCESEALTRFAYESKVCTVTGTSLARILQPLARRHHGPNSQSTLLVFHPERSLFSPPSPYLRVPAAQCVLSTLAPICHQLLIIRSCVFCVYCSTMCGVCHQDPCRCKVGRVAVCSYGLP